jgi:hypothetical protein
MNLVLSKTRIVPIPWPSVLSSFQQDGITPDAAHLADLFVHANDTKAAFFMKLDACGILGEDPGLERP